MITCVVDYTIDPAKLDAFERFARAWIGLVNARGGQHHGYFLPGEGASRNVTTQRLHGLLQNRELVSNREIDLGDTLLGGCSRFVDLGI